MALFVILTARITTFVFLVVSVMKRPTRLEIYGCTDASACNYGQGGRPLSRPGLNCSVLALLQG